MHAVWHSAMSYSCMPGLDLYVQSSCDRRSHCGKTNILRKMNTCIAEVSYSCGHQS